MFTSCAVYAQLLCTYSEYGWWRREQNRPHSKDRCLGWRRAYVTLLFSAFSAFSSHGIIYFSKLITLIMKTYFSAGMIISLRLMNLKISKCLAFVELPTAANSWTDKISPKPKPFLQRFKPSNDLNSSGSWKVNRFFVFSAASICWLTSFRLIH